MSFDVMAEMCNVSSRAFSRVLQEEKINTCLKRRYLIRNDKYFEKIDNESKAYFLGLLFADGYNGVNNETSISLKNVGNTSDVLNILIKELQITGIGLVEFKPSQGFQTNNTFLKLAFSNCTINQTLKKLGMTEHKELSRKEIPKEILELHLTNHFIRGLFDGDGNYRICNETVKLKNSKKIVQKATLTFMGNLLLLEQIRNILKCFAHTNDVNIRVSTNSDKIYELRYKGKQVDRIKEYLYSNATIYLTHKQ